ncbi:hypothetical protein E3N88_40606 [Mikania micrantha]|uniref:HMA domain-containing protein n=1 Tax=Mikania micrantha TaxID=192012 RepID=A0A5N6LN71_9ASTR|nr:hypothetical protein E3N88_40606 [Mikania micrantha]
MNHVVEQLQLALQNQQTQEIVLKVFLDCEGCADKVRKSLKYFKGVEKVVAQCGTDTVIVKGNIANPSELVKRVSEEIGRKVELLTPPPTEELKTSRNMSKEPKQQGPAPKQENKKDKVPVLVISKEREACVQDTKNSIMKTDGNAVIC